MATLEHSYALNSAVALSLNTLHRSLSRYIYLCKNFSVNIQYLFILFAFNYRLSVNKNYHIVYEDAAWAQFGVDSELLSGKSSRDNIITAKKTRV